ncbi:hypothetical protein SERLA73DRAFT_137900, partial [Serpula lacrymans var. lacrymans S7.3]
MANEEVVRLLLSREDVVLGPLEFDICMALIFRYYPYLRGLAHLFLARWTSVNFRVSCKDKTPLSLAAWYGDEKSVKLLLACHDIDVNAIPEWSSIPPLWAAADRAFCGH